MYETVNNKDDFLNKNIKLKGVEIPVRLFTQKMGWDFFHLHLLNMVDEEAAPTVLITADGPRGLPMLSWASQPLPGVLEIEPRERIR